MKIETNLLIGNSFEAGQDAAEQVFNPRTGEVIIDVPEASTAQVDRAVAAARKAFETFSQTTREERLALIGDSAHGIHPIAGQGLNLGLRDVGALVEVLAEGARLGLDPGDPEVLKRYENWRGLDSFMVALATDGLTRLFGVPGKTASAVRRLGMAAVQRTPLLKQFFMDEARGVSGDLPELLRG